ncbi:organic cation transporter protein-like [Frankliniella occidentalis]|uniref:Organic cation transporter protein-like n=1 Tax=Frankliniella occidentalis TaxID=133901 RepID=A0A9C6U2B6_FRAOC|nr:organic cation transporter protein-like [Frankliniella occidentalis]
MVGMPLAGFLSDRFGRKTLLMWSWVVASVSGIVQSFSVNFTMFLFFEFLNAFCSGGVYPTCFLLALEFVGPQQRVLVTTLVGMFYSSGNALMGALAWAVRDWRWLLRAVYGGGLVFAIPLWFTPESVRWLVAVGRLEEADAVVARVAAINKVTVEERLSGVHVKTKESAESKSAESDGTLKTIISLFKSRTLLLRFITCALCWLASFFVYYGLLLNTVTLSGDQYLNFALSGLVEIPSNLLSLWLQYNAGRRWSVAGTLVVAGVFCLAIQGVPADLQWLVVALYILGRFTVINSINLMYVVTAEMFPTNVRQSMLNYCMTVGRIGIVLAPQTPLLATVSESLPLTLFGVVSLSSGLLALLFPETTGRPLPETLEEAESMGADQGCCGPCRPPT